MKTYRLIIKCGRKWKWGLHDYTFAEAIERQKELEEVGIKSAIEHNSKLFK